MENIRDIILEKSKNEKTDKMLNYHKERDTKVKECGRMICEYISDISLQTNILNCYYTEESAFLSSGFKQNFRKLVIGGTIRGGLKFHVVSDSFQLPTSIWDDTVDVYCTDNDKNAIIKCVVRFLKEQNIVLADIGSSEKRGNYIYPVIYKFIPLNEENVELTLSEHPYAISKNFKGHVKMILFLD